MACSKNIQEYKGVNVMSKSYLCVIAIELGIKHSTYGMSWISDFKSDPLDIITRRWHSSFWSRVSSKTPSCILFRPDQTFHSFGYDAEEKYEKLTADEEHNKWYFFKHPTKMLYESKDVDRTAMVFDETNKPILAIKVYTATIQYLTDDVMKRMNTSETVKDMRWVLPVPDIWDDAAKQLIREAAIQSGIPGENLMLCLETEAVSTLFRYIPIKRYEDGKILQKGMKYLILNAGDEFSSVAALEVLHGGNLRELHKISSCPWGEDNVNQAFIDFMKSLVGAEVIKEFKEKNPFEYMDMLQYFRGKKMIWTPDMDRTASFSIPAELAIQYMEREGINFYKVVIPAKYSGKVSFRRDILRFDLEIVQSFFSNTSDSIVKHIKRVLHETNAKDISTILMTGELSESHFFQDAVKKAFPDKTVFVSEDCFYCNCALDVLRGSVIFGHDSNSIITTNVVKNTCRGPRKL